jgi:hypothetical protein
MTYDDDYGRHFTRDHLSMRPTCFSRHDLSTVLMLRNTDDDQACHYTPYLQYYLIYSVVCSVRITLKHMGMSACLSLERLIILICS